MVPAVGDWYVYSVTRTPTLPAGQRQVNYTYTRSYPGSNPDGTLKRLTTFLDTGYVLQNFTADLKIASSLSNSRQCTYSPVYSTAPYDKTIGETFSSVSTRLCQPLAGGSSSALDLSLSGTVLSVEKITVASGSYDTFKYGYTENFPYASGVSSNVYTIWTDRVTGRFVKSESTSSYTPAASVSPAAIYTETVELVAYSYSGRSPVGPSVQRFAGYWNFEFVVGNEKTNCSEVFIDLNGTVSAGLCEGEETAFSGVVDASGAISGTIDGVVKFQGNLNSPGTGSGNASYGVTTAKWDSSHD